VGKVQMMYTDSGVRFSTTLAYSERDGPIRCQKCVGTIGHGKKDAN
jgi:hypothetical protein